MYSTTSSLVLFLPRVARVTLTVSVGLLSSGVSASIWALASLESSFFVFFLLEAAVRLLPFEDFPVDWDRTLVSNVSSVMAVVSESTEAVD